ncbi:hypothetical protein ACFLTO_07055 [Chloroflexota bacterium]
MQEEALTTKDKYKTKEQLITELIALRQRVTEKETVEHEYHQVLDHLHERTKELSCIYTIAQVIDDPKITFHEIYQQVVDLLPMGFQYPDITRAKIVIDDKEFKPLEYRDTNWELSSAIEVYGVKGGIVEVCYSEQKPEMDVGPFLNEEWLLLSIVAGRLGRAIERMQADKAPIHSKKVSV